MVLTKAEIEANLLLSEPVETVEDLERSRREEKRKAVELAMKRERLATSSSPSKGKGRLLDFDSSDDDGEVKITASPTKAARTPTRLSPTKRRPVTPPPRPTLLPDLSTSPSPSLGLPFGFPAPPELPPPTSGSLAPSLAHLLSLHTALERALILHLSTHGSSIASTVSSVDNASSSAFVRMTNLIDLPTMSRMLEASGKRFTENELRKLCWVWEGCGSRDGEEDAEELHVQGNEAGGMGFLITRARLAKLGKVSSTYGLGISVGVKANPQLPKFELLSPSSPKQQGATRLPPSPNSIGKGRDGMSIVALWTQGKEERRREFERRLKRWARNGGRDIIESELLNRTDHAEDLRWATSTNSHLLRHVPIADLPPLDFAVTAVASSSTPSPKKPFSGSTLLTSPSTPRNASANEVPLPVVSPKDFVKALLDGRPVKTKSGSTSDRDKARRDRVGHPAWC